MIGAWGNKKRGRLRGGHCSDEDCLPRHCGWMDGQTDKLMPSRRSRLLSTAWLLGDLVFKTGDGVAAWVGGKEVGREGQEGDRGMMAGTWTSSAVAVVAAAVLSVWLALPLWRFGWLGPVCSFRPFTPHYSCPRRSGWMDWTGWSKSVGSSGASCFSGPLSSDLPPPTGLDCSLILG